VGAGRPRTPVGGARRADRGTAAPAGLGPPAARDRLPHHAEPDGALDGLRDPLGDRLPPGCRAGRLRRGCRAPADGSPRPDPAGRTTAVRRRRLPTRGWHARAAAAARHLALRGSAALTAIARPPTPRCLPLAG